MYMYPVTIYHPFKYQSFWYLLVLYVNLPVKPPDFSSKRLFFYFSRFWWPFAVTIYIAPIK